jgi:hypothetical protein
MRILTALVVVVGKSAGLHGEFLSLYNETNLATYVLFPLSRMFHTVKRMDCTGESLSGYDYVCPMPPDVPSMWHRLKECWSCLVDTHADYHVRVRPDVHFLSPVTWKSIPPIGKIASRVRAARGWTGITNQHFSYNWENADCSVQDTYLPCVSEPPIAIVDDQFAVMNVNDSEAYFVGPTTIPSNCTDPMSDHYPERRLTLALRLAGVDVHLITVQMRLTRDVLRGNALGQAQPARVIEKLCS